MKQEKAFTIAFKTEENKKIMLDFLLKNIEENGLRTTARKIELNPGTLSSYKAGKAISYETLSDYILKLNS